VEKLLADHVKAGRILRVRRGLYATVPAGKDPSSFWVNPYLLAGRLAPDAAVAYHAALQFWGKVYIVWDRIQYVTRLRRRPFRFQSTDYHAIQAPASVRDQPDMGGGIVSDSQAGGPVRVTSYERTLVDVLDAPDHGGGWEEIWRSLEMVEYFELEAVVRFALDRRSALTAARVGFFLDQHRETLMVDDHHLVPLRNRVPRQPAYLDRQREPGRLVKPWNLVVPERVLSRTWEEP